MYTLCVIDMQPYFGVNANTTVSDNIAREIRQAIIDDAAIIFVEYKDCGNTLQELTDVIKHIGHTKVSTVLKTGDDGSKEIMEAISNNGFANHHLKLVGVNTDCCVYRTAGGLRYGRDDLKIEVIADACSSNWSPDSHKRGLKNMRDLGCHISNDT